MVKFYCDGCGRHIKDHALAWAQSLLKEVGRNDNLFCETCAEFSGEYWDEKDALSQKISQEITARLENHCNQFFTNKRKSLIEVVSK